MLGGVGSTGSVLERTVSLSRVSATPISASIHLTSEGWGTRIEMDCRYSRTSAAPGYRADADPKFQAYALYVTDAQGNATEVATWSAGPGSRAEPSGSTSLTLSQIASVDVRSVSDGTVLLAGKI